MSLGDVGKAVGLKKHSFSKHSCARYEVFRDLCDASETLVDPESKELASEGVC